MKIAMIGLRGIPSRAGGVEIHVEQTARRLVQMGCSVEVYCRRRYCTGKGRYYEGIRRVFVPALNSRALETITHSLLSTLTAVFRGCEIIHYHALGPSALAFIPRLLGRKVVCTIHGLDWKRSKWGGLSSAFLKFGEYASASFAHSVISVSRSLPAYYREKYGRDIEFIGNGTVKAHIRSPQIISRKYGLEKDSYILFMARLVPEKGAHYLIEAYNRLSPEKKLVIAGSSSHTNGYEKSLRRMAGGSGNIIFTGHVEGKEQDELYSNAYMYVLPSDIEGMPISLLEAMTYGNCCLVSDIEENASVVSDFGYTFTKGSINDLALKMSVLLSDEGSVHSIKRAVTGYAKDRFNWDRAAERTLKVYEEAGYIHKLERGINENNQAT